MKKVEVKLMSCKQEVQKIKTKFLKINLIIILIFIFVIGIVSAIRHTVITSYGDIIWVSVKPYTDFPERETEIFFKVLGMKKVISTSTFVEHPPQIPDITFKLMFEGDGVRYYNIEMPDDITYSYSDQSDQYIIIDTEERKYISVHYSLLLVKQDNEIPLKYVLPFARYFIKQGHYEWFVDYGEYFIEAGDSEIENIIFSIAKGEQPITEPHLDLAVGKREQYEKDEIYKKCIMLYEKAQGDS